MKGNRRRATRSGFFGATMVAFVVGVAVVLVGIPAQAVFPGANGRIVFSSDRDGNPEIYSMNPDGSGVVRLTNHPAVDHAPVVSPDGSKIAFTSYRDSGPQIWVMGIDGSAPIRVTDGCGGSYPAWSPDGQKIAFTEFCFEDIYVVNADGTDQTGLATTDDFERFPSWSPDGTKIAYSRFNGEDDDIWVMDADGSNQVDLTNDPANELHPDWSPDGSRIAFARVATTWDIFVMNADGSALTNLTNTTAVEYWPVWSPDGSRIAFAEEGPDLDIWTMAANGTGRVNLTSASTANENVPDWQAISGPVANLGVALTDDPDPVAAGSELTYLVEMANEGPDAAANATVSGTIPSQTTYVSLGHPEGWLCTTPSVGGVGSFTCTKLSLSAGADAVLTLVVNVDADITEGTTITGTVTASTDSFDPASTNNAATATTTVGVVAEERCTITGTDGADVLEGTDGDDVICGGKGQDTIDGGGGNDLIIGGNGGDIIAGGDGDDILIGWKGRDELVGGAGYDIVSGGNGRDQLDGVDGVGGEFLDGGRGKDVCVFDETDIPMACVPPEPEGEEP